jgi:hypothetical protein
LEDTPSIKAAAEQRLSLLIIRVGDKMSPTLKESIEVLAKVLSDDYRIHSELILKTMRAW